MVEELLARIVNIVVFVFLLIGSVAILAPLERWIPGWALLFLCVFLSALVLKFLNWLVFDGRKQIGHSAGKFSSLFRLDTREQRIAFIVCMVGGVIMIVALIFHPLDSDDFLSMAFFEPSRTLLLRSGSGVSLLFWIGLAIAAWGAVGALMWDRTYGRLGRWIRGKDGEK